MPPIQLRQPFGYNFYETCLSLIVAIPFSALAQEENPRVDQEGLNTCHFNEFNKISSCRKPSLASRSVSLPFPQVNCSEDNESLKRIAIPFRVISIMYLIFHYGSPVSNAFHFDFLSSNLLRNESGAMGELPGIIRLV